MILAGFVARPLSNSRISRVADIPSRTGMDKSIKIKRIDPDGDDLYRSTASRPLVADRWGDFCFLRKVERSCEIRFVREQYSSKILTGTHPEIDGIVVHNENRRTCHWLSGLETHSHTERILVGSFTICQRVEMSTKINMAFRKISFRSGGRNASRPESRIQRGTRP